MLTGGDEDVYIEDGTFTYRNYTLVTTGFDQTIVDIFTVESDGDFLDFLNFEGDNGCKQFWRFGK